MQKISNKEVKMLPKAFFMAGHFFLIMSISFGVLVTSIFFALLFFRMEMNRPIGLTHLGWLSKIPWEYALLAIIFLLLSLILLKKSELAYKIDFGTLLLSLLLISVVAGFVIKQTTPTRNLIRQFPYHRGGEGLQKNYLQRNFPKRSYPKMK